jgi:hypothetical protein
LTSKYKVVFAIDYEIEAEDANDAEDQACKALEENIADETRNTGNPVNIFGVNTEKIE